MSATGQGYGCSGTHLELDTAEAKAVELAGTLGTTLPNSPPVYFTGKEIGAQRDQVTCHTGAQIPSSF